MLAYRSNTDDGYDGDGDHDHDGGGVGVVGGGGAGDSSDYGDDFEVSSPCNGFP